MATLPQLIEDDIRQLDGLLREFMASTEAIATLIIDKGGFLITQQLVELPDIVLDQLGQSGHVTRTAERIDD